MKKRAASLALALVLCLGLLPVVASASQVSATPITYEQAQAKGEAVNLDNVDVSQFKDWKPNAWWAKSGGVRYAIGMGYIVGREGPTVAPGANVTEAEFVTVLVRACLTPEDIAKYKAQALEEYKQDQRDIADYNDVEPPTDAEMEYSFEHGGVNWYVAGGYYHAGEALGIVKGAMNRDGIKEVCTRAQMASLLVRAMKVRGEDTSKIDTGKALGCMNDRARYSFSSGDYAGYGQDIGVAIGAGLIIGDQNKDFNPELGMTRAEMAEVILRLDNPKMNGEYPRDTALSQLGLEAPSDTEDPSDTLDVVLNSEEPITIDMRTPTAPHRAPKEGDTVIRGDGTSVVLARDPVTGVLGYGQNVGPYLGTEGKGSGHIIAANEWIVSGLENGTWTDPLAGGWYIQSPVKGQEYTYHWSGEWTRIKMQTNPNDKGVSGTDGEYDESGLWKYYSDEGQWIWKGPRNV